jgi:hypothetical protein
VVFVQLCGYFVGFFAMYGASPIPPNLATADYANHANHGQAEEQKGCWFRNNPECNPLFARTNGHVARRVPYRDTDSCIGPRVENIFRVRDGNPTLHVTTKGTVPEDVGGT